MGQATTLEATTVEGLVKAASAMDVALQPSEARRLLDFVSQLHRWNRTYNLTAIRDTSAMVHHHLLDSLAILPFLDHWLDVEGISPRPGKTPVRLLDVGSGGGLPGIVLAMMRPQWQVVCIDAVEKKMSFVRQMSAVLALPNLSAVHARVEQWQAPAFDVVISRAFASLSDFVALAGKHLDPSGILLAMKGKYPEGELNDLAVGHPAWHLTHQSPLHVPGLNAERCLLAFQPRPHAAQPGHGKSASAPV